MKNPKAIAAIAGLLLTLAMPWSATAGDAKPAQSLSIESTIADLLASPQSKAVVEKYLPGISKSDNLSMIENMSLQDLSAIPQANIDDAKLKSIQKELSQIK